MQISLVLRKFLDISPIRAIADFRLVGLGFSMGPEYVYQHLGGIRGKVERCSVI